MNNKPIEEKARKYRKKPVEIEAIQWTGKNLIDVQSFIVGYRIPWNSVNWDYYEDIVRERGLMIKTLEGEMKASSGDYIIKGIQGEFYPCKSDIFEQTYEKVIYYNTKSNESAVYSEQYQDDIFDALKVAYEKGYNESQSELSQLREALREIIKASEIEAKSGEEYDYQVYELDKAINKAKQLLNNNK